MDVLWGTRPPQETIELGLKCLRNVEELYENSRDYDEGLRTVNQFYFRLGRSYLDASMYVEAEQYFHLANDVVAEAIEKFPKNNSLLITSAVTKKLYGTLLSNQGRFQEAVDVFDTAAKDMAFVASLDPSNLINRVEVANVRSMRASTLTAIGKHDLAVEDLEFGVSLYEEKLELVPGDVASLRSVVDISFRMIDPLNRLYRFDDARTAATRVLEILDSEGYPGSPSDPFNRWYAKLNIGAINAYDGKLWDSPTPDDRAFGLYLVAFLFSASESGDSFDDKSIQAIRLMEPESTFTTVTGMFDHLRSLPIAHPVFVGLLPMMEARIYARQAQLIDELDSNAEADKLRIEDLKKQSMDLLVPMSKTAPTMLNFIYLEPDLIWLRGTDAFAERGLVLEGAD